MLLSNSARDMQQVLLAGGPYPADGLVSSLEMCARRAGAPLPAIGQLTLDHLAPLQKFVQENSSVSKVGRVWFYILHACMSEFYSRQLFAFRMMLGSITLLSVYRRTY